MGTFNSWSWLWCPLLAWWQHDHYCWKCDGCYGDWWKWGTCIRVWSQVIFKPVLLPSILHKGTTSAQVFYVSVDVQGVSCRTSGYWTKELTGNLKEISSGGMRFIEMSVWRLCCMEMLNLRLLMLLLRWITRHQYFYENCHKVCVRIMNNILTFVITHDCKCENHKQAEHTDSLNFSVVMGYSLGVYWCFKYRPS